MWSILMKKTNLILHLAFVLLRWTKFGGFDLAGVYVTRLNIAIDIIISCSSCTTRVSMKSIVCFQHMPAIPISSNEHMSVQQKHTTYSAVSSLEKGICQRHITEDKEQNKHILCLYLYNYLYPLQMRGIKWLLQPESGSVKILKKQRGLL